MPAQARESAREADFEVIPWRKCQAHEQDTLVICSELEVAGMLPNDVILTIVEIFVETFRINFIAQRREVENYLREVAGKDESLIAAKPSKITIDFPDKKGSRSEA